MILKKLSVLSLIILCLTACSHQQLYDAVQQGQQVECQKLQGELYQQCLQKYAKPYQEYQQEREQLKK